MKEKKDEGMAPACKGCVVWEKFGKTCYYYWEHKKVCTMWAGDWDEVAQRQPVI